MKAKKEEFFYDKIKVSDGVKDKIKKMKEKTKETINDGMKVIGIAYEKNHTPSGKKIFKKIGENKTTIGLSQEFAKFLLNLAPDSYRTQIDMLDYEDELTLFSNVENTEMYPELFGFSLSTDGGMENHIEPVLKKTKGYSLGDPGLVPFRMIPQSEVDINVLNSDGYHIADDYHSDEYNEDYYRYFVKEFDSISFKNIQENGEEIAHFPDSTVSTDVELYSVIDLEISIDIDDLKEHFGLIEGNINNRRYNAITLYTGKQTVKSTPSGNINSYRDILATNRMNVRQRDLGEEGTQNIVYRLYL